MEFLIYALFTVLTVIPLLRLLPHFGVNSMWALAAIIPLGVLVLLWVMASRLKAMEER